MNPPHPNNPIPRCTVLLATHNGERWLQPQLESIYAQSGVVLHVVANDDESSDHTNRILLQWACSRGLEQLPNSGQRRGSANRNFLQLIMEVDIGESEYVALADQDDIWYPDKLARAIDQLSSSNASAYSSNVEAFWPNGYSRIIKKSQPQRSLDYLFSSPGPGCTFVFQRELFLAIQNWSREHFEVLSGLWVHDWLLYAYVRGTGYVWKIDDQVTMRYRQHESNEIGANHGLSAMKQRWKYLRSGTYHQNILSIGRLVGAQPRLLRALERLSWRDKVWLIGHVRHFRRNAKERIALMLAFFFMESL
ncbi:MAG: glycosyltransferase [Dechloromonas sp.]|nr:glycosyltransferase [Dechloromonas sp.]